MKRGPNQGTPEWLEARKGGIGASEIAMLIENPFQLYLEKTGQAPPIVETEAMRFGKVLEETVAREFVRATGIKVERWRAMLWHRHAPMFASLDRVVKGEKAVLECKMVGAWMGDDWGETGTDEVPLRYALQVMAQLSVTGYVVAYLGALLLRGPEFRWYRIERDDDSIEALEERCAQFWAEHILPRNPPPAQSGDDLDALYRYSTPESIIMADEPAILAVERLRAAKSRLKEAEKTVETEEMAVKGFMQEREILLAAGGAGPLVTWKTHNVRRLDSKAIQAALPDACKPFVNESTARTFLVKKQEGE